MPLMTTLTINTRELIKRGTTLNLRSAIPLSVILGFWIAIGLTSTTPASAQTHTLQWSGVIAQVLADDGTGVLTGGAGGATPASGEIEFLEECTAPLCDIEVLGAGATGYEFGTAGGSLSALGVNLVASGSKVEVYDDGVLDQGIVDFFVAAGFSVTVGQVVDLWVAQASVVVGNNGEEASWSVGYLYTSSDPLNSSDYVSVPPLGADFVLFALEEGDETVYSAVGGAIGILQGTDCQPGSFVSGSSCFACAPGTFSAQVNATSCAFCPAGQFADQMGSASCSACAAGTAAPSPGSVSCFACAAGSFSLVGATSCDLCPGGTFSGSGGQASCTSCAEGTIANGLGNASCTSCGPGTSSPAGAEVCDLCPAGTSNGVAGGICAPCESGFIASAAGSTECVGCNVGSSSNSAQTACDACAPGTFNGVPAGICTACEVGTIAPSAGSAQCISCSPGSSSDSQATVCIDCDPGTANGSAGGICEACSPGEIAASSGSVSCLVCPVDTFAADIGSVECLACPAGTTAPAGSASCSLPPPVPVSGPGPRAFLVLCLVILGGASIGLRLEREV